jgi:hypothetical protein
MHGCGSNSLVRHQYRQLKPISVSIWAVPGSNADLKIILGTASPIDRRFRIFAREAPSRSVRIEVAWTLLRILLAWRPGHHAGRR